MGSGEQSEWRERAGALEDALGVVGMEADALPLAGGQRAGLLPDPVRHRHPAEVVEEARGADLRDLTARAAERAGGRRRKLGHPRGVAAQKPDLEVGELAESPSDELHPRARYGRHRRGLGIDYAVPGVGGVRDPHERLGIGEDGVDDLRIVAAAASAPKSLDRRLTTAVLCEGDEVVRDPDDAKRPGDLLAGDLARHPLAIPAFGDLPERLSHLVRKVKAAGEKPAALAQVRRHLLEPLLSPGDHLRNQARAVRKRPVVREAADQVAHVLKGLGGRADDARPALEIDLVAPHPAGEERCAPGAAEVHQERNVIDLRALLGAAIEPVRQLERSQADPELVLKRLAHAEVRRQRQRSHQLRHPNAVVGRRPLHGASLNRALTLPSGFLLRLESEPLSADLDSPPAGIDAGLSGRSDQSPPSDEHRAPGPASS